MTDYPGKEKEYFIVEGGQETGPLKGLVELIRHNVQPDTPVWYEGLSEWTPALLADMTRQLFEPGSAFYRAHPEALAVMQGRMTGADPDTLPTLRDDDTEAENTPGSLEEADPELAEIEAMPAAAAQEPPILPPPAVPSGAEDKTAAEEAPKSYLAWAIVVTILCCLPAGVVSIVYSSRVKAYVNAARYAEARRYSERAQWWLAVSVVAGLVEWVAMMLWWPFML